MKLNVIIFFFFRRSSLEGGLVYFARKVVPQPPFKMENQRPFLLPRLPYEYDSENIEATAFALMVYVERQELYVDNIVRYAFLDCTHFIE